MAKKSLRHFFLHKRAKERPHLFKRHFYVTLCIFCGWRRRIYFVCLVSTRSSRILPKSGNRSSAASRLLLDLWRIFHDEVSFHIQTRTLFGYQGNKRILILVMNQYLVRLKPYQRRFSWCFFLESALTDFVF